MEKEHGQRALYVRSQCMENKTFTWCLSLTHTANWNHMLTDRENNGKLNFLTCFPSLLHWDGEFAR